MRRPQVLVECAHTAVVQDATVRIDAQHIILDFVDSDRSSCRLLDVGRCHGHDLIVVIIFVDAMVGLTISATSIVDDA